MVTVLPKPQGDYGGKKTHFTVEKHLFSMTFVIVVPRSVTCCIYLRTTTLQRKIKLFSPNSHLYVSSFLASLVSKKP